ncbi:MAG: sugar transferase [Myxococcales bacterium]
MTSVLGRVAPGRISKLNLLLDLSALVLGIGAATLLSGGALALGSPLLSMLAAAVATWAITSTALRHYDLWAYREVLDDAALVTVLSLAVATVLAVLGLVLPSGAALLQVGYFLVVFLPVALALRLLLVRRLSAREERLDEVLIVGTGPLARATADYLERGRGRRRVAGFIGLPFDKVPDSLRDRLLGDSTNIDELLAAHPVNEVYIAGNPTTDREPMQRVITACETLGIPFALPVYGFRLSRAKPLDPRAIRDGYVHYVNVESKPSQMALKRLFDIVVSAAAIWCLLPLFALVALLIKLTSKGPVLFKQVRIGRHGRPFHMLKFRSMVADAEALRARLAAHNEQSGPVFKMSRDPRITPLGRVLRKFSIDELPQLINVLRGEMSIVGPRPPLPAEVAAYKSWQRRRLSVSPGLTCIWQVSGRNQIPFEDWMYLDMRYIDHWSFRKDLNLILKTFPVVFTGRGAK